MTKYTFKNGATVIAETIEQAYAAILADYGYYIACIKREKLNKSYS